MENDQSNAIVLIEKILDLAINGVEPVLSSAEDLAQEYLKDKSYEDNDARVNSLIRWEMSKNFSSGFITGLGGLLTLPVAIPASLTTSWVIQARLAAAIAIIYGHDIQEDRVRTMILLSLLGDSAKEVLKKVGIIISQKMTFRIIHSIPGRIFIEINKRIGFRLITKAGERGIINLTKMVPILGGFVGGSIDLISSKIVGNTAAFVFS